MKAFVVAVLMAMVSSAATAQFVDGNELKKLSDARDRISQRKALEEDYQDSAQYLGYIEGAFDAQRKNLPSCVPEGMKAGQLGAVVTKYLLDHPEHWGFNGSTVVYLSVLKAFSCVKK
jgi:hypothetical protein